MSKEKDKVEEKKKPSNKNSTSKKNTKNNNSNTKTTKSTKVDKKVTSNKETKEKSKDTKEKNTKKKKEVMEEKVIEEIMDEKEQIEDYDEDTKLIDEDFDEDFLNDEEEKEEIIEVVKKKKNETKSDDTPNKKEEMTSQEKIKKIAKKARENNKTKKKNADSKIAKAGYFLEENRIIITSFLIGVLLTTLIAFIIWPDRIATLKNGTQPVVKVNGKTYTADDLYERMKSHYSVSQLLDAIDNDLLTKMYPETDEMNEEVKSNAEYYINMYQQYYNYTQEQFLAANGFATYDDYLETLKLENRRNKYLDEYVEKNLKDDEIQKYYEKNVYGDINCQHILVETSSDSSSDKENDKDKLSDEDAKKLAEEIIDKINDGTSWDDIKKEYKDKVTFEDLGYQSWDADLEDSFKTALKDMKKESYSEEPVKTSYGYHVIYRKDQKSTPKLSKVKDKIIENLVAEKKEKDENLLYKALINLRDEKKIEFNDTDMKAKYKAYCKQYK